MGAHTKRILYLFLTALILSFIISISSCSNGKPADSSQSEDIKGFTFFDLGSNSLLTDTVRERLEDHLGSEAIEKRTTIDLSIHYSDFLKNYFPHLDELNKSLNWPPRERVEHNITKLMYRYAAKNKLPFSYVELFFSDYTQKPILFRISAGSKSAPMVETLKTKYGPFQMIQWKNNDGETLFWKNGKDVLTVSLTQNRYDRPEYLFCIFFVNNLQDLVEREKAEQKTREEKIKDAGKTAF